MLENERKFFEQHRLEWMKNSPGKFALVKKEELVGTFDTVQAALAEGARRFGTESFLVRQVEEVEQLFYIPALTLGILRANSTHSI
jgi:hypothetical protein